MAIPTLSYLQINGDLSPSCSHKISDEILLKGLKTMLLTRHIDERMITLQRQGSISFAMSSLGEEACAVASAAALTLDDWMYPQYREQGVMFWRGFTPQQYIHHMFSNAEDIIYGRQMPNHFGSRELNVVTVSSPLGNKILHAAGCAYGMKLKGKQSVAICYFGEGTTSKGSFHVGLNFASVRKAPVIFFCRNNGYAISTKTSEQYASDGIAIRGAGYGIHTLRIDGNDFYAIHESITKARQYCLEGKGPVLIEAMTYRMGAHSTSDDPSAYRDDAEVKKWEKKDPITRLKKHLKKKKIWTDKEEIEFTQEIKAEVDKAIQTAKETPHPLLSSIIEDVYFEVPEKLKAQLEEVMQEQLSDA